MLRGETVEVRTHEQDGVDAYNAALTKELTQAVDNVLVAPQTGEDLGEDRPNGVVSDYTLYFPKAYDGPPLENAEILVRGDWLRVVGHPDVFDPALCPTAWNMVVEVTTAHG